MGVASATGVQIFGQSLVVSVTPTISTTAYAAGNNIGGANKLANVVKTAGGTARLRDVVVVDASNQKAALDILVFNSAPTGTYTDKTALTVAAADIPLLIGRFSVLAADYLTVGGLGVATNNITGSGTILKALSGSNDLWIVVNTNTISTYTSTTALTLQFGFIQD